MADIKINRALRQTSVGRFPGSADAMLNRIPAAVVKALSSIRLAELLDAMWLACQEAKEIATSDICSEGAIWDTRTSRLRELAS